MTSVNRDPDSSSSVGRRVQLSANAVVVAYIHAISERHRPAERVTAPGPTAAG